MAQQGCCCLYFLCIPLYSFIQIININDKQLVMALYENSISKLKAPAGISKEFSIRVGVDQGPALSPLLLIVVMQEAMKEARRGGLKELLYADDLVLMAESEEEAVENLMYGRRGWRVNMEKVKVMIPGEELMMTMESGRYLCGYCERGVGENSVGCAGCECWCHQRCSGL